MPIAIPLQKPCAKLWSYKEQANLSSRCTIRNEDFSYVLVSSLLIKFNFLLFSYQIAEEVGSHWHPIGIHLGFSGETLTQYEKQFNEPSCLLFEILDKWKKQKGKQATKNALLEACRQAGVMLRSESKHAYKNKITIRVCLCC